MIEDAARILRHVEIRPAVAIVVTDRDTHAVGIPRHASFLRHVRKCAVAVVAIECVAEWSRRFIEIARSAIRKVDVHPAVVVVVEERAARAYGLRQVHFRRLTTDVNPRYTAGRGRNFFKRGKGIRACSGHCSWVYMAERGTHPRPPENLQGAPPRNYLTQSHFPAWFTYAAQRRTLRLRPDPAWILLGDLPLNGHLANSVLFTPCARIGNGKLVMSGRVRGQHEHRGNRQRDGGEARRAGLRRRGR